MDIDVSAVLGQLSEANEAQEVVVVSFFDAGDVARYILISMLGGLIIGLPLGLAIRRSKKKRFNLCPTCKKSVAKNAISCPNCGHSFGVPEVTLDPPKRKSHLIKLVVILVTLCLFGTILGIIF